MFPGEPAPRATTADWETATEVAAFTGTEELAVLADAEDGATEEATEDATEDATEEAAEATEEAPEATDEAAEATAEATEDVADATTAPPLTDDAEAEVDEAAVEEDEEEDEAEQVKSYKGVVLPVVTPKEGAAPLSFRVYHQVLVCPNSLQPTASQYDFALAVEGTACPLVGPLAGHPVSVTQTGLP